MEYIDFNISLDNRHLFQHSCLREKLIPFIIETNQREASEVLIRSYLCTLVQDNKLEEALELCYMQMAFHPDSDAVDNTLKFIKNQIISQHYGPKLTIIVPVFNSGTYLDKCIDSIRSQNLKDIEIIIVNDGSTDDSQKIIDFHAKSDSRITVITNDIASGNPGTPRNQALEIANGLYLGFVDSDDWIEADFYKKLLDVAEDEKSDIVFSSGFINFINEKNKSKRFYDHSGFEEPSSDRFKIHESFMVWDKIFFSPLVKVFGMQLGETKAAVDVPFIFQAYLYSNKVSYSKLNFGYNYRRESSSSVTVSHRKNSNCEFEFQAFKSVYEWAKSVEVPSYYTKNIDIKLVSSLMYTLKVVGDEYYKEVFENVKEFFYKIDKENFERYCVKNKKWWLYKEYKSVLYKNSDEVKAFIDEKEDKRKKEYIRKLASPQYKLGGGQDGILFFPCWVKSNPYQDLFYKSLNKNYDLKVEGFPVTSFLSEVIERKRNEFKYIHLHWLHNFFSFEDQTVLQENLKVLKHAKKIGYEIIYTAHNIISHESNNIEIEKNYRKQLLVHVDYFLAHGEIAKNMLINEFEIANNKISVVPHGTYENFYGERKDKAYARKHFNINQENTVFLFFGNIRGYKGIFNLIDSFNKLRKKYENITLLIAGRVLDTHLEDELKRLSQDRNIILNLGFVEDQMVKYYFSAADICVLPFEKVLSSGSTLLSLTFSCPVLAPSEGVLPEVIDEKVGRLFKSYIEMQNCMEEFHLLREEKIRQFDFSRVNEIFSWGNLTKNLEFF